LGQCWLLPIALLLAYGLLRLSFTLFTELRELVFRRRGAARRISLSVPALRTLSLRFHLGGKPAARPRDIGRGTLHSLISYSLYSIIPTLIRVTLVLNHCWRSSSMSGFAVTLIALVFYITFTVLVTNWRTRFP
jgi:ATP-binding cassette subfamily B protein